jgi:hypothetical protein
LWAREQAHHRQRRCRGGTGSFHGGKLDLHLPKVEVEENPRTKHSPRSAGEVAGVEHDFKAKTLDPLRDQIEPSRMQSSKILG